MIQKEKETGGSSGSVLVLSKNQPDISSQILYHWKRHRVCVVSVINAEAAQPFQEGCVTLLCGSIILSDSVCHFPSPVRARARSRVGLVCCFTISEPTGCDKRYLLFRMTWYETVAR